MRTSTPVELDVLGILVPICAIFWWACAFWPPWFDRLVMVRDARDKAG